MKSESNFFLQKKKKKKKKKNTLKKMEAGFGSQIFYCQLKE